MPLHELEEFTEIEQEFLDSIAPERRLAGLAADEQLLALSDDVPRLLPDGFADGLPPAVREKLRTRLLGRGRG